MEALGVRPDGDWDSWPRWTPDALDALIADLKRARIVDQPWRSRVAMRLGARAPRWVWPHRRSGKG